MIINAPQRAYIYYMYIRVKQVHLCSATQNANFSP